MPAAMPPAVPPTTNTFVVKFCEAHGTAQAVINKAIIYFRISKSIKKGQCKILSFNINTIKLSKTEGRQMFRPFQQVLLRGLVHGIAATMCCKMLEMSYARHCRHRH